MNLRALIVDDERLARNELRRLLSEHDDIEIVGEADCVLEAIKVAEKTTPAVVFLDIQMPGQSGFDAVAAFDTSIHVVFVTAYDQYAIRAFDVNALDYLLKPVRADRLAATLDRVRRGTADHGPSGQLSCEDRLFVTLRGRQTFLQVGEIAWIEAAGDYTQLVAMDGRTGLTGASLDRWEERLPGSLFGRIHRSTIVNFDLVDRVERQPNQTAHVFVRGFEAPLTMSRRYSALLKKSKKGFATS